jgi:hypothetical protein
VSRDQSKGALALALAAATLTACATPVGVERADVRAVHQALTANALSAGRPSAPTVQVLHRLGLFDRFERAPDATLAELHRGLAPTGDEDRLFALAELSFLRGEDSSERSHLLAAAAYAYAFLFPGDDGTPPGPFDPRLRLASDLYNRALTGGMAAPDRTEVVLEEGTFELPFGSLEIVRASPVFRWVGYELASFVPAANFEVRGLRNRYRQRGIGAPLAASLASQFADGDPPPGHARIPVHLKVPTTALLRFESPRARLAKGRLRATLELHSPDDSRGVSIDGREVPLEFETTSALALGLEGAPVWDFELAGFRSGDFQLFGPDRLQDGLVMLHPYRPGRIPVVLVHGTASSPARWAELLNELENDPRIWERFQLWLFLYNTGNPVALSGALLREALIGALSELDPEGQDPALQRMVVIGHSQGGLLTKLTSVESGNRFWENLSEIPISELELEPATRELLRDEIRRPAARALGRGSGRAAGLLRQYGRRPRGPERGPQAEAQPGAHPQQHRQHDARRSLPRDARVSADRARGCGALDHRRAGRRSAAAGSRRRREVRERSHRRRRLGAGRALRALRAGAPPDDRGGAAHPARARGPAVSGRRLPAESRA